MPPHGSPKFNEPWMDELDGENCIQRTLSFGLQGALIGKQTLWIRNATNVQLNI